MGLFLKFSEMDDWYLWITLPSNAAVDKGVKEFKWREWLMCLFHGNERWTSINHIDLISTPYVNIYLESKSPQEEDLSETKIYSSIQKPFRLINTIWNSRIEQHWWSISIVFVRPAEIDFEGLLVFILQSVD